MWKYPEIIKTLSEIDITSKLKNSLHGIERECLRIDENGNLSQTIHPQSLGSKLTHPHITTDYAECQLELVTNPYSDITNTLKELHDIHHIVYNNIGDELLWPMSTPCWLPDSKKIPVAQYGSSNLGRYKTLYRQGLKTRYNSKMQMLSGVHYNFSLSNEFWDFLCKKFGQHETKIEFKNQAHFSILRNFNRYQWLLLYLFGASPAIDKSYVEKKSDELAEIDKDSYYGEYATTLRMSNIGYSNNIRCGYTISLSDLSTFIADLNNATKTPCPEFEKLGLIKDGKYLQINGNILQIENEYYATIRPRQLLQSQEEKLSEALKERGVNYLEIRSLDIDPFSPIGINEKQLQFVQLFLLYCLFKQSPKIGFEEQVEINENKNQVALKGRKNGCLLKKNKQIVSLKEWAHDILDEMETIANIVDCGNKNETCSQLIVKQRQKIEDESLTLSAIVLKKMKDSGKNYIEFGLYLARKYKDNFLKNNIDKKTELKFKNLAKKTLADQQKIEAADRISFEDFLTRII